jgi:hypothetical protein
MSCGGCKEDAVICYKLLRLARSASARASSADEPPPRQIGPFMSQVLTLGVPDEDGSVVLLGPDKDVPLGGRLF